MRSFSYAATWICSLASYPCALYWVLHQIIHCALADLTCRVTAQVQHSDEGGVPGDVAVNHLFHALPACGAEHI